MMRENRREHGPEEPHNKESYVREFENWLKSIHEGSPSECGLRIRGGTERKSVCEDVKLKNSQEGLFLVADGVSSQVGWFASRETVRTVYQSLGKNLDQEIQNIVQKALELGESPLERVTDYVGTRMIASVAEADSRIKSMGARHREFSQSASTLSLAKLVAIPDGQGGWLQRLFFLNVGDSRIYLQRKDGGFQQLTRDDRELEQLADRGEMSRQQAMEIDQAPDFSKLSGRQKIYARNRGTLTNFIGMGDPTRRLKANYLDVHPGERFVLVSDGVSDQILTPNIQESVGSEMVDERAEERLQQEALNISLQGRDPRSKADDISVIVSTVRHHAIADK